MQGVNKLKTEKNLKGFSVFILYEFLWLFNNT
jgi:hypothetical protein